jgi:hypothetical protein
MANQTIAFSVPYELAEDIKKMISAIVRQYNVYGVNSCSKGKALHKAVKIGFEEILRLLNEHEKSLIDKKIKMEEILK